MLNDKKWGSPRYLDCRPKLSLLQCSLGSELVTQVLHSVSCHATWDLHHCLKTPQLRHETTVWGITGFLLHKWVFCSPRNRTVFSQNTTKQDLYCFPTISLGKYQISVSLCLNCITALSVKNKSVWTLRHLYSEGKDQSGEGISTGYTILYQISI